MSCSDVCEAMEGVSISSPSLTPKMRNKGASPPLSRPKKPIPPPLVLRDEHEDVDASSSNFSNSMLTEFAIIATSPRSPLMQKHLPIRKRAYSFSSMESLHSYTRLQPLTPPPGLLSPPSSHVSCSSLTSSTDEIQDRISPVSTPGALDVHQTAAARSSTSAYRWPIAVWQCFLKGVRVQILGHNNGGCDRIQSWLLVDEINREADFQNFDLSQYAPNGLRLLDACPTTAAASTLLQLRFEPVDPVPHPQPIVLVEFACDHPFFVKDKGWSSAQIELTARTYGIPCRSLQPSDICLPPSHSEATFTSNIYDSVKSFDFTPEDTSAVFALSSMAKKQMQSANVPAATMSPPISPVKKCLQATANNGSPTAVVESGGKAKRPMNGFMMFAKKYRVHYTHLHPGKDNRAISCLLGETWKRMSGEEKFVYSEEARINAAEYKKTHPDCWKRFKKQKINQQQCWPNYSRRGRGGGGGHRRGRRRGRSSWWIGGEGISYDRWPSRGKPALDSIATQQESKLVGKPETEKEPEIRVDMARLITGDNAQDATGGLLLIEPPEPQLGRPLPASPNGQQPDAGAGHCDLNLLAENLVGGALKDVLDSQRRLDESLDSTLKDLDVDSSKQPAETYMRDGDNKYPPLSSSTSNDDLLVNRWNIADNENHDDDVVVRRPFASSMSSRAAADASKYYKLCSSEVDDFGPNSRTSTLGDEIIIHELDDDDASECGSEDVEMFGHRYETSAEKRYKNSQVSLASEIMSVRKLQQQNQKRDMDGDEDLKLPPISVESDEPGCYTNTQALEGYYGQIRRPPKDRRPVSDVLDSGIHTSDDGGDDEDDEILFSRRSTRSGSGSVNANFEYQPLKNPQGAANQKTPLVVYLKSNPWYYGCCSVM